MMKMLRDTRLMFIRNMQHTLRSPVFIFVSMFQPLLYLFLFMPLLNGLGSVPGIPAGRTVEVFIPGLLVMQALFGSAFVGFSLIDDIRTGVIERFLVTPVKRPAILLGRVLRDAVVLLTPMCFDYISCYPLWAECKCRRILTLSIVIRFDWSYYGIYVIRFCSYIQN